MRNLERVLGVRIHEFPTARMSSEELYANPKLRADDLNDAFSDPRIAGIISTIGGDESVRILPHLDLDVIRANPKVLMGYSDVTTLTTWINQNGIVTFNGPSIMAGFAQMDHLPRELTAHVRAMLSEPTDTYQYRPYGAWCDEYVAWSTPGYAGETLPLRPNEGWKWLQGRGVREGRLFGGCIEVMEFLKATRFWPAVSFWENRVLFFETSEEKPSVERVTRMLRNYGSMGAIDRVSAILVGRARSYSEDEKQALYDAIVRVVTEEFGHPELPVIANMDFGHTDPQFIMPLGVRAEIDCDAKTFRLLEAAVL